ncbi:MAG: hypothetical protein MPJ50_02125 [Pirellulales bacterium]|nr:hypothetical protein [Pirellulales bacterium]
MQTLELWLIHPHQDACAAFARRFESLPYVVIHRERYEDLPPHDCFVTAGNAYGIMSTGIDAAVIRVMGRSVMHTVQSRIVDEYLGEQTL